MLADWYIICRQASLESVTEGITFSFELLSLLHLFFLKCVEAGIHHFLVLCLQVLNVQAMFRLQLINLPLALELLLRQAVLPLLLDPLHVLFHFDS